MAFADGNHAPKGPFVLNRDSPQAKGLVGWWPMQEVSGDILRDYSGYNQHAVRAGAGATPRVRPPGSFGQLAGGFDGTASIFTAVPTGPLAALDIYTAMFWANAESGDSGALIGLTFDWGAGSTTNNTFQPFRLNLGLRNYHSTVGAVLAGTGNFRDDLPHHCCWTHRSATDTESYLDGFSHQTSATSNTNGTPLLGIDIGGSVDDPNYANFSMWDVRIYNRGITATEALEFWNPATRWDLYKPTDGTKSVFPINFKPPSRVPRVGVIRRGIQKDGNHAPKGPFVLNRDSPQARGLVGWWPVQSLGPTIINLVDASTNLDTIAGTPTNSINSLGQRAKQFLSASSESIGGKNVLPTWGFTICCWFNNGGAATQTLWSIGASSTVSEYAALRASATNNLQVLRNTVADGAGTSGAKTFVPDVWNHAVGLVGPNLSRAYVNGVAGADNTASMSAPGTAWDKNEIGRLVRSTPVWYYEGGLADIRVYDRLLTQAEVDHIYNPATRWDLYHELNNKTYVRVPPEFARVGKMKLTGPRFVDGSHAPR